MKFGGSSLGNAEKVERAAQVVLAETQPAVVVVSAIGDTTEDLLEAGRIAERGDKVGSFQAVQKIENIHRDVASGTQSGATNANLLKQIDESLGELRSVLHGVSLLGEQSARSRALIVSFGERLSVAVMAAKLEALGHKAAAIDARDLIVTDDRYESAFVHREPTYKNIKQALVPLCDAGTIPVVTGYIAATSKGVATTLGRSGSDYTATLIGRGLNATEIHILTDVDGIATADPRLVKEAHTLPHISYREAAEMAHFGARVLHPRTILPAEEVGIPIRVRSSANIEAPGTLITDGSPTLAQGVKMVTSINQLALVTISGRGIAGVPGIARRIFEASEAAHANAVMISQSSSEQTVSIVVPANDVEPLVIALKERFASELARNLIQRIAVQSGISVISIIGRGMTGKPGTAGKLFGALGQNHINVLAIAQGGSELSISVAIRDVEAARAVRAVHTAFGLTNVVHIALVGCGNVGQEFLRLLKQTQQSLAQELGLELRLVGVATRKHFLFNTDGIDAIEASSQLLKAKERPDDDDLIAELCAQRFTDVVVVDVTASDTTYLHRKALEAGFHVVTANKIPFSQTLENYRSLQTAQRNCGVSYNYETTFGAGLPVLHTLKELLHTGDHLQSVVGCLSGTLGALCSWLDDGMSLSEAVSEAEQRGYTEPRSTRRPQRSGCST